MPKEVVGRAVLPAREGWVPAWVRRLLGTDQRGRRRGRRMRADLTRIDDTAALWRDGAARPASVRIPEANVVAPGVHVMPVYTGPVRTMPVSPTAGPHASARVHRVPAAWPSPRER